MYDFNYKDVCWIPQERIGVGGVCSIADYFFNFSDIRLCVDEDVEWKDIIEWYDYNCEGGMLGLNQINLKSWLMGAPRVDQTRIKEIKAKRKELEELIKETNEKNEDGYKEAKKWIEKTARVMRYELHYFEKEKGLFVPRTMEFKTLKEAEPYLEIAGRRAYILDKSNGKVIKENQ